MSDAAGDLTGATSGKGDMRYSDLKPVLLPSGKPSANDFHHLTQVSIARCVGLYFISSPSCALRSISFPDKDNASDNNWVRASGGRPADLGDRTAFIDQLESGGLVLQDG